MAVYGIEFTEKSPIKNCHRCKNKFPRTPEYFQRNKNRPDGLTARCRPCAKIVYREWVDQNPGLNQKRSNEWRAKNPDKSKAALLKSRLKNKFNMTVEEYEQMKINQDNRCAICNNILKLCVDHCHTTKKIRGLLCGNCNKGLGMFLDDPKRLRDAASYLEG